MGEVIRILEGKSLLYEDIVSYYRRNIMSEDYIVMHGIDDSQLKILFTTKPFFSNNYVVEIHMYRVNNREFNLLKKYSDCDWITMILICSNADCYQNISGLTNKSFDGYRIPEVYWIRYVKKRLKSDTKINMSELYKSIAGRYELTDIVIDIINNSSGMVTLTGIRKIIGKSDRMSFDMMWFNILRKDGRNKGTVFKLIEEYRYGYNFVYKNLLKHYEELIKYYKDFHSGKFNELKLRDYKKETNDSAWKLKTYMELFSEISFDEILVIGELLECSKVDTTADMFILIGKLYSRDKLGVTLYG